MQKKTKLANLPQTETTNFDNSNSAELDNFTHDGSTIKLTLSQQAAQANILFNNNQCFTSLAGCNNEHLKAISQHFKLQFKNRANQLYISGAKTTVLQAISTIRTIYDHILKYGSLNKQELQGYINMTETGKIPSELERNGNLRDKQLSIITSRKIIFPYSAGQADYIKSLKQAELIFGVGPAGTGKTYLAVAYAVYLLEAGLIERIILSRPAVEAGEKLGFLPGDMKEKVDPYLRPLYDALHDLISAEKLQKYLLNGTLEVAPLAFMRGRTLKQAAILLDEAQNTTSNQMKMFLTRLGEGSKMIITGDPSQIDLPYNQPSGLIEATNILKAIDGIKIITFSSKDIIRHELVNKIVDAYNNKDKKI